MVLCLQMQMDKTNTKVRYMDSEGRKTLILLTEICTRTKHAGKYLALWICKWNKLLYCVFRMREVNMQILLRSLVITFLLSSQLFTSCLKNDARKGRERLVTTPMTVLNLNVANNYILKDRIKF